MRTSCRKCGEELNVPFACKSRGCCPSCMGRRMAEGAALLVDHVLPAVGYRQWVLSFARVIGTNEPAPLWAHWFPFSKEASEALGAARDQYDRIFIGGYVTAGGSPQTWLVQISP